MDLFIINFFYSKEGVAVLLVDHFLAYYGQSFFFHQVIESEIVSQIWV